ncbi:MAG: queuosine precursor transporter [Bacteroidales bacterium]|nr:queuosine precursor transporter [Bacteroidales bacterium]
MKKTDSNLVLLSMVFAISLIIANMVTAKLFITPISLFGVPITLPGAVFCYTITFLMTDVIGEIWGAERANRTVKFGFIVQILASILILLTQFLPATDPEMQKAYEMLLGQNWIFVIGSLTAYACSQTWDVFFFHKIRNRYIQKHKTTKGGKWIWNNLSTMTSQIIDTIIFITISFGLGFGWLFNREMWPVLGAMIVGQYVFKFLLALIDTPIFYLLTKNSPAIIYHKVINKK